MSRIQVNAWRCDRCGHVWLSASEPRACAKCKSRSWNTARVIATQAPAALAAAKDLGVITTKPIKAPASSLSRTFVAPLLKPKDRKR